MKVITIHGIRKKEEWDLNFKGLSIWQNSDIEVLNFDYGFFSIWKFIWPFSRRKVYKLFQEFYSDNIKSKETPSIVCHSFGTKIFLRAIKTHKVIKFDKVILCGSILNSKTRFDKYFKNNQIKHLYNDYGTIDNVVWLSRFIMKDCGKSGKVGFKNLSETDKQKITQRENYYDHSEYFLNLNMSENWARLLLPDKKFKYNKKILRDDIIDRIDKNKIERNIEYSSISYYARIDEMGNYYANYKKNGVNKTGSSISDFEIITTADSLNSIEDMKFVAYDKQRNSLSITHNGDSNQNKSFLVHFDQPVNNNQEFFVVTKFRWKETINQKNGDTDHFEINNARNISIKLNFKQKLKSPRFFVFSKKVQISEQKATLKLEKDKTFSYSLEYANDENSDGIIFYFEGADNSKLTITSSRAMDKAKCKLIGSDFSIHKCVESDIRNVYAIELKVEHSNAASENKLKQRLSTFNDGFLVAKMNNKVVGYIESIIWNYGNFEEFNEIKDFALHYNPDGKELYIIFIAIAEEYRKNGIATALIQKLEQIAKEKYSVDKIKLVAKDDLVDFYSKLGFNIVRELPNFLNNRQYKSVLMEKYLNRHV